MADSQPESNIFSLRIVSIDYYMSPPVPDMDICYSSFQGGMVNEVPVVRIYGSTPAGQKTCLHVHRALPYLYVPCADISSQPNDGVDAYTHAISLSIEKALKLKGNAASRRQHVHGCSLVRAKRFYGYHTSEELFVKIYLYHPQDISRAASLLLGGAVLDGVLQPHESHIPFLLQFLVDYNLCGMGHVHLSKLKFRPPIPNVVSSVKAKFYRHGKDMEVVSVTSADFQTPSGDLCSNPPVWTSSTLPDGWLWQYSGVKELQDKQKRSSTCELEGDATIDDILNQQSKLYSSLSQTCSDVKMVQSLIPIWEEEYQRTGMHGAGILSSDHGKPSPHDVLRTFSAGLNFESNLMDLRNEVFRPLEKDDKLVPSIKSDEMQNLADHVSLGQARETSKLLMGNNNFIASERLSSQKDYCASGREGKPTLSNVVIDEESLPSDPKGSDEEAIGLLKWFVSSQAAQDINSDDEVVCETILSPMLISMSIDKVLERANMDFESESQQECQDILDSIADIANFEVSKESGSILLYKKKPQASSEKRITQLYSDDQSITLCAGNTSAPLLDSGNKMPLQHQIFQNEGNIVPHYHSPKTSSRDNLACASHTELSKRAIGFVRKRDDSCHGDLSNTVDNYLAEADTPTGRSLRDLMRRKRSYKVDPSECEAHCIKSYSVDDDPKERIIIQKEENDLGSIKQSEDYVLVNSKTERKSLDSLSQKTNVTLPCDPRSACCSYGKLPLLSKKSLSSDTSKVIFPDLYNKDDDKVEFGFGAGSVDLSCQRSPEDCKKMDDFSPILNSSENDCNLSPGHLENENKKESKCMAISIITNDTSGKLFASSFLECDVEQKDIGNDRSQRTDVTGIDILSTCPAHEEILVAEDKSGQNTTSMDSVHDMVSDSYESTGDVTSTAVHIENSGRKTEIEMCLPGPGYFMLPTRLKEESIELTAMTFCKKPPKAEFPEGRFENELSLLSARSTYYYSGEGSNDGGLDELPPFFVDLSRPDMEIQDQLTRRVDSNFHQGAAMGVPIHLRNDGSYLYMLTPANTPPSADSICGWLLHDATGVSGTNFDATITESSFLKGSSTVLSIEDSRNKACTKLGENHDNGSNTKPFQDHIEKQSQAKQNKNHNIANNIVNVKAPSDFSQDISQISGPDRKMKPTPLSQTGFRDPASVGGGQQLTSVSVEILAESRGDIRPDPRYDAINVIAIAIEDDTDSIPVAYLLLRCREKYQRNLDGISDCTVVVFSEERELYLQFMKIIYLFDPDILLGWDIQGGSLGFLAERAAYLGIGLLDKLSRTPSEIGRATTYSDDTEKNIPDDLHPDSAIASPTDDAIIEDEWGRTHGSGVHIGGRIVLNIWRLMRGEIKLNMYTVEAVAEGVLRRKIPSIPEKVLMKWFLSGPGQARHKCVEYMLNRAKLNLEIVNQLDMINRTSELARVFGIDFFSVLSRGSQYRVESMLLRLAHTQNYIAISPGNQQVASQPAMECIPLVMEPESGFYKDPVIVLDFQSLYPSMIIAYNLCFSTCLGKVLPSKAGTLGVSSYSPEQQVLQDLKAQIMLTPNGVMYVPPKVRKGVLPRLLEEILSTRIMVKQAMKKLSPSQKVLQRIFDSRQLALKLIANVTYGYTAAGFSGRMPCAELADSIVQCGRLTLETAISFVNAHDKWKARVIYGDTDSMFVLLKGRSVKEAFRIGQEIVSEITAMNPVPVTLKLEKVYYPCFLITKKRYVGFSYESPDQTEPVFDAKGIETVRRDTCTAVAKTMEQSLRLFFKHQDILEVKSYLLRQWTRILSGRVSLQDFIFAKEVRLGTYSSRTSSSLPPAAIVATKAMRNDPRAEPRYGERVPYIVIHGEPGARLVDMVVDPFELLVVKSPLRLNELYYINKQIIPALQRVFGLVGADLKKWFVEMPRPVTKALSKQNNHATNPHRTRIDYYYLSKRCLLCGELVQASARYCSKCSQDEIALATAVIGKTSRLEREMQHLAAICRHCGGGDWLIESGVKCTSLACSVFFERRKVQKELMGFSDVATESGYYPPCMIEWF